MKTARLTLAAVVLFALAAGGCSNLSPGQQAVVASDTLKASVAAVRAAHTAGYLDDRTFVATEPAERAAYAAVQSMFDAADAGSPDQPGSAFWRAARAAEAALAELLKARQAAERAKVAPPVTVPPAVVPTGPPAVVLPLPPGG